MSVPRSQENRFYRSRGNSSAASITPLTSVKPPYAPIHHAPRATSHPPRRAALRPAPAPTHGLHTSGSRAYTVHRTSCAARRTSRRVAPSRPPLSSQSNFGNTTHTRCHGSRSLAPALSPPRSLHPGGERQHVGQDGSVLVGGAGQNCQVMGPAHAQLQRGGALPHHTLRGVRLAGTGGQGTDGHSVSCIIHHSRAPRTKDFFISSKAAAGRLCIIFTFTHTFETTCILPPPRSRL